MYLPPIFAPLRARNFRFFFIGQAISLPGSWFSQTAIGWLVYELTRSPSMLGWANFLSQVPNFLFMPLVGVMIDRINRHKLLQGTAIACLICSLLLVAFGAYDGKSVKLLLALCFLRGIMGALEMPTRQSLVLPFVGDRALLGRAIALNSMLFNLSRMVGPAMAGQMIAWFGSAVVCFYLDALSYLPVILLLMSMRFPPHTVEPRANEDRKPVAHDFREGLRSAWKHPLAAPLLLGMGALSFFTLSYATLLPMLARTTYSGGPQLLGYMMAVSALGAVSAALVIALRNHVRSLVHFVYAGSALIGVALVVMSFIPALHLALAMLYFCGMGGVLVAGSTNALIQEIAPEALRGRFVSFFTTAFTGLMPFGGLFIGCLTDWWRMEWSLRLAGVAGLVLAWVLRSKLRSGLKVIMGDKI